MASSTVKEKVSSSHKKSSSSVKDNLFDDFKTTMQDSREWLEYRDKTIQRMKKVADKIHTTVLADDITDMVGDALCIEGSIIETASAIPVVGEFVAPLLPFAVAEGIVGSVVSGAAQVDKAYRVPKEVKEAQDCIDQEIKSYVRLNRDLRKLCHSVDDVLSSFPEMAKFAAAIDGFEAGYDILKRYVQVGESIAKDISKAVSKAASTAATKAAYYGHNSEMIVEEAKEAAKKAASETIEAAALKGFSKKTTEAMAETVGEAAGKAAMEEADKAAAHGGWNVSRKLIKNAAEAAAEKAAKLAAKKIARESAEVGVKEAGRSIIKFLPGAEKVGEVFGKVGGKAVAKVTVKTIGRAAGHAVPVLNLGFAAWDSYDFYEASKEIVLNSDAEKQVRKKISELAQELEDIRDAFKAVYKVAKKCEQSLT